MNPYLVLNVPAEADDEQIRRAYLARIKESPPESAPERFQEISAAYQKIKDEPSRHQYILTNTEPPGDSPLDVFAQWARHSRPSKPLPFDSLKELLRSCLTS